MHNIQNLCYQFYAVNRLLVNSRLLVVKFLSCQKLYLDF